MNYPRNVNLQTKVIVVALSLALVPLIILAMLDNWSAKNNLTNVANQSLSIAASQTAKRIDQFLLENLLEIESTGQLRSVSKYLQLDSDIRPGSQEEIEVSTIIRTLSRKNLLLPTPYALLDATGTNVLDYEQWRMGADESDKKYFQIPFQTSKPYISPVIFSPGTSRQAYFYISGPVFNVAGNVVGVVRMSISITFIQDFIANTSALASHDSFGLLMDANNFILAHSQKPKMVFRTIGQLTTTEFKQLQESGQLPNTSQEKLTLELPVLEQLMQKSSDQAVFSAPLTPHSKQAI